MGAFDDSLDDLFSDLDRNADDQAQRQPFKFLDAYTTDDRDLFFGRDTQNLDLPIHPQVSERIEEKPPATLGVRPYGLSIFLHELTNPQGCLILPILLAWESQEAKESHHA